MKRKQFLALLLAGLLAAQSGAALAAEIDLDSDENAAEEIVLTDDATAEEAASSAEEALTVGEEEESTVLETDAEDAAEESEEQDVEVVGEAGEQAETVNAASGTCGDNLTWTLDDSGTLTISGTGEMEDSPDWGDYEDSIKKVVIQSGVTSIGEYAFSGCDSLTSVTIPDSVTSIGDCAFWRCDSLTSVTIPDSVTSIGDCAFDGCDSLTSVTIPNSVTSIGDSAFSGCDSLTSVTIPDSVTSIGDHVFYLCESLTSISVDSGNSNYSSQDGVLYDKAKKTLIQYPIGNSRTSFTIPDSVTSIGEDAFSNCSGLTSVTIGNSVTSIGDWAFGHCSSLTSVTIPDSVTSIGENAFYGCDSLTSVTIPNSVTSIGDWAFQGGYSLTSISVDSGNRNYSSQDGVLYDKAKKTLIQYPIGNSRTSFTIPNSVTSIGYGAFGNCSSLTSVTIPNSVTSIGKEAFWDCSSLTSVTIPNSVTSIGWGAFYGCDSLTDVYYTGSETQWNAISLGEYNFPLRFATIHYNWSGVTPISECTATLSATSYTYSGSAKKPTVTVKNGSTTLKSGTDYTVAYSNNTNVGTATVKITGKGNYTGTLTKTFKITAKKISGCTATLSATSYTYSGSAKKPTVTIKNGSTTLKSGTDYTVAYSNNTNVGTATVKITGKGNYTGTLTKTFKITAKKISGCTATLSATSYTYSGSAKKPTVTVKNGSTTLKKDTDYTVSYSGNKNVGKATVKIAGKGNYSGTKTVTFKINPKATTLKSVTAASKGFTAKWTKQATQTTGYEIQYATNSKFTGAKTVTISKNKTVSKKVTKLTAKKKYYVRIRTYKTVSGTKYVSSWSKAKTVTTKK